MSERVQAGEVVTADGLTVGNVPHDQDVWNDEEWPVMQELLQPGLFDVASFGGPLNSTAADTVFGSGDVVNRSAFF